MQQGVVVVVAEALVVVVVVEVGGEAAAAAVVATPLQTLAPRAAAVAAMRAAAHPCQWRQRPRHGSGTPCGRG